MRSPTAAALAAHGDGRADVEHSSRLPALVRALDGARLLATPHAVSWNQSQLLTVHVADGATAAYNIPMAHWLRRGRGGDADGGCGVVSASTVASSVSSVADRHAVLRSTYEVAWRATALRSACVLG